MNAPEGLRLLAKWLEAESIFAGEFDSTSEVTTDLRRWATQWDELVGAVDTLAEDFVNDGHRLGAEIPALMVAVGAWPDLPRDKWGVVIPADPC